jgi:hypothetical protein
MPEQACPFIKETEMAPNSLQWLAINDDASAEFEYWKGQLLFSLALAAGCVLAMLAAISLWPAGSGDPELRAFVREFWSLFIECAFWLGFLIGLMWGAARRLGCGLAGSLPWQPAAQLSRPAVIARHCGQAAACLALAAVFLAGVQQLGVVTGGAAALSLFSSLAPLTPACLWLAAFFALAAIAGRVAAHRQQPVGPDWRY